jgi:hypothetical protein
VQDAAVGVEVQRHAVDHDPDEPHRRPIAVEVAAHVEFADLPGGVIDRVRRRRRPFPVAGRDDQAVVEQPRDLARGLLGPQQLAVEAQRDQ